MVTAVLWLSVWAGVGGAVEIRGVGILVVLAVLWLCIHAGVGGAVEK